MLTYADVCIAAACDLDYDTMAGGDKFGNVFLCRLSSEASDALADTTSGAQDASLPLSAVSPYESRASKLPDWELCEEALFHVGEAITSIQKAKLVEGGAEAIIYSTIAGGIGCMQPFVKACDATLLMRLEMHLRGAAGARERSERSLI